LILGAGGGNDSAFAEEGAAESDELD
jgi:hypothetical protein